MYSTMNETELKGFLDDKINSGKLDPDFMTCLFVDKNQAIIYDALELPGQRTARFIVENNEDLQGIIRQFRDMDIIGYIIVNPEIETEVIIEKQIVEGKPEQITHYMYN